MNKATLIKNVNTLVQAGETGEAINALLDFLDRHQRQQPELYEEVIQLKAIFKRAKRQAAMNIISQEHAAQELEEVNDTINDIVRKINRAFKERKIVTPAVGQNRTFAYGMGAVAVALCLVLFTFWGKAVEEMPKYCPDFDIKSSWHTLIVPYQYSTNAKTEIQTKLDSVSQSVGFDAICQMADINFNDAAYPNTLQKAKDIGTGCRTDLIFWKNISEDRKKTRYRFVQMGDYFQFNLLNPTTQSEAFDTIVVETSIPTSNEINSNDNDAIYSLLLGISANKVGKHPIALRLFNSIPDSINFVTDLSLLKWMYQADSYRLLNDKAAAIESYSTILTKYDGYTLASMNRGVLHWSLGNYDEAMGDFDTVLSADSSNVFAFGARGRTCIDMNIIDEAEEALMKAESLIGEDSKPSLRTYKKEVINPLLVKARKRKSELHEAMRLSKDALRRGTNDSKLSNELARAYLQVGNTHRAIELLYQFGPNELENSTKQIIRHRITAMADENFLADLEALVIED